MLVFLNASPAKDFEEEESYGGEEDGGCVRRIQIG